MKKLLLLLFLSVIPILPFYSVEGHTYIRAIALEETSIIRPVSQYHMKYEEVIDFIKVHEGFRTKVYGDINGIKTIGHGLVVKYIPEQFSDSITYGQSDSIVRSKIDLGIKRAKKKYPNLNEFQYLTVSHLYYCKGVGGITKHPIHQQIKRGYINRNTLIYYSKYEVERPHYRKTRRFEWKLWNFKEI